MSVKSQPVKNPGVECQENKNPAEAGLFYALNLL